MATLSIEPEMQRDFETRWKEYVERTTEQTPNAIGRPIIAYPPMHGPNEFGRIIYPNLDLGFLDELRKDGFGDISDD